METQSFAKQLLLLAEDWILIVILSVIFAFYFYYTANFDFFEKKGAIPYMKPVLFLGNLGPRIRASGSFHDDEIDIYNHFRGNRFGGTFIGRTPVLYIIDPELIKTITIRDFDHFTDRFSFNGPKPRYMNRSLSNLKGAEWKGLRNTITPVFSSARLKNMLPLINLCTKQMVAYLSQYENNDVEMKDAMGRFTLEVTCASAFDLKCDALSNKEDSHFIKVTRKLDDIPQTNRMYSFLALMLAPKLIKRFSFFNLVAADELVRMLQAVVAERRLADSKNKDFLQTIVDAEKKEHSEANITGEKHFDDDTIGGMCLFFIIAGYDLISTLLSFAIHVMTTKPDLQEKLRAHIQERTAGKEMSYELLSELDYLEAFLLEILRMYPPISRTDRTVTKPYILPKTNVKLNVGDVVAIPIYGLHMDPEYYPEPKEFRPERFMGDEKKARPSHLFLVFGAGQRNCIGIRFVMIIAKIAMVSLMQNFKFTTCAKTQDPLVFHKTSLLLKPNDGIWVRLEKL